jgi:hypothetical protein
VRGRRWHAAGPKVADAEVNMPPRYWWGKRAKILKSFGEQKSLDFMPRIKRKFKSA